MNKIKSETLDKLFSGVLKLETVEECYAFFSDACTIAEILAIKQRFEVAEMLTEGKIYNEIVEKTGVSTATISRVNKALEYGNDGYKLMLERLKDESI